MEEFKMELRQRIGLGALYCGMIVFVMVLFSPASGADRYGMILMGLVLLSGAAVLCRITVFTLALKKADELEKLYSRETDRQSAWVREKSGAAAWKVVSILLIPAALAAGTVNRIVSLTLWAAELLLLTAAAGMYWYYRNKR